MIKIFIDSDVCLDLLTDRHPFSIHAIKIFSLGGSGELDLYMGATSFTNIFYLMRKELGSSKEAIKAIGKLKTLVTVLPVTEKTIEAALNSNFADFEDAVQYYAAMQSGIKTIVTRNVKDYKVADCVVLSPEMFLKTMGME